MATWIGVPFQMLATIFAGYWFGSWLDEKYAVEKSWWTIGLTLFAVLISLYQLIVQVQRMGKNGK
ncbi:AtpZ/AtpI family protein [Sphingobacterium phlebotomi]|uniref:AtpZ/AtpI family protein n=1 Tax=Sphingobacterium phlebotomi TaxID=2605433 RepID=A0A5D4H0C4_9SPHI|nr:AtpZ/AtpI family protein [Sphingobacterium phlebotomi]TYR33914.1 AtpZ/AtpI family protein [Sphingobacterium phlebotomi]